MTFELFLLLLWFVTVCVLLLTIYYWQKDIGEKDKTIHNLKVSLHYVTEERDSLRMKIVI